MTVTDLWTDIICRVLLVLIPLAFVTLVVVQAIIPSSWRNHGDHEVPSKGWNG